MGQDHENNPPPSSDKHAKRRKLDQRLSNRRPKSHKKPGEQFFQICIEVLESLSWEVLSLSGHRIIARLIIELAKHGGTNNGRLTATYEDFEKFGMDRHSIGPAIRECEALGLIEITDRGRAGNAEFCKPTQYRITFRLQDATYEWRRITTIEQAITVKSAAREPARKKQKPSGGKYHFPVGEKPTTGAKSPAIPVVKTPTTIDISSDGAADEVGGPTPGRPAPDTAAMLAQIMRKATVH